VKNDVEMRKKNKNKKSPTSPKSPKNITNDTNNLTTTPLATEQIASVSGGTTFVNEVN